MEKGASPAQTHQTEHNGKMFKVIEDFTSNRTFNVKVGVSKSQIRQLQNGTPQGSVISPTLFLVNDRMTCPQMRKDVNLSLFADDSTAYTSGKKYK